MVHPVEKDFQVLFVTPDNDFFPNQPAGYGVDPPIHCDGSPTHYPAAVLRVLGQPGYVQLPHLLEFFCQSLGSLRIGFLKHLLEETAVLLDTGKIPRTAQ